MATTPTLFIGGAWYLEGSFNMQKKDIVKEAKRIHEAAMWSAQSQFEQAKIWSNRNTWLGIPSTGLSAVAGVGGLADIIGNVWTGSLAIAASFLTAILTTLNYSKKVDQAHASANATWHSSKTQGFSSKLTQKLATPKVFEKNYRNL